MKVLFAKVFGLTAAAVVISFIFTAQAANQDNFWADAARGGMAEVALSNIALQKTQNEQVRQFAQQMVTDHTAVNTELMSLAASKNVTLPTDMDSKSTAAAAKLNGLTGTAFDRQYMKTMVKDHEKMVKLFQRQSERGSDADAKAFAAKTLPALQGHLQMARTIETSVKASARGNNGRGNDRNTNSNSNSSMNMNSNSDMNMNSNSTMNMNMNSNSSMNSNSDMNLNMNSNSSMNMNSMQNTNSNQNRNSNRNSNTNRITNSNGNTNRTNSNTNSNVNSNSNVNRN
ncbi:MAG: DUF4142 domain-containing protein [Pyrinomonadaceae bacterium]